VFLADYHVDIVKLVKSVCYTLDFWVVNYFYGEKEYPLASLTKLTPTSIPSLEVHDNL